MSWWFSATASQSLKRMTNTRTMLSTAMAMALASCATSAPPPNLSDLPRAHQNLQVASAQNPLTQIDAPQPLIAPGHVILTRTEEAAPGPTAEDVQAQLNQATAAAVEQARKVADQAVAEAKQAAVQEVNTKFKTLSGQTNQLLNQTTEVLRANNAAQQNAAQLQLKTWQQAERLKKENQQQLGFMNAQVSATLADVTQNSVKPAQAQAIAQQAVEQAAPQFQALALQSVKDSKDYIRTIARTAVQDDSDPAMKDALSNAARDVITKDDRIVFAIRKVVDDQMETAAKAAPASQADTNVSTAALTIAAPQEPGGIQLAAISPAAGPTAQATPASGSTSITPARNRSNWIDIRKYRVVVHEDGKTLEEMLGGVLAKAQPFTGPWQVKWKISEENKDILQERFSLDVETSFDEFVGYLAQYMVNDRGIKITFSLFDADRIIVVSD